MDTKNTVATVATALRSLRSSLGLTQADMASCLGVALATYVRYETGKQSPKALIVESALRIAQEVKAETARVVLSEELEGREKAKPPRSPHVHRYLHGERGRMGSARFCPCCGSRLQDGPATT